MTTELQQIFTENPHYKAAYDEFLELHKNGYGKNSTPEELVTFEGYYARDFLNGLKAPEDTSVLIKGERLTIRRASLADADFMESVELDEDNSPWVGHWHKGGSPSERRRSPCSRCSSSPTECRRFPTEKRTNPKAGELRNSGMDICSRLSLKKRTEHPSA